VCSPNKSLSCGITGWPSVPDGPTTRHMPG
jgi:hypothetical protein